MHDILQSWTAGVGFPEACIFIIAIIALAYFLTVYSVQISPPRKAGKVVPSPMARHYAARAALAGQKVGPAPAPPAEPSRRAAVLHGEAQTQLDAAEHAIGRIREEIRTVTVS